MNYTGGRANTAGSGGAWQSNLNYQKRAGRRLGDIGSQYAEQGLQNPWLKYQPGSYGQQGGIGYGTAQYSHPQSQYVRDVRAQFQGSADRAAQQAGKTLMQAQRPSRGVAAYGGGSQEGQLQRDILSNLLGQQFDVNKAAMDYGFRRSDQALEYDRMGASAYNALLGALPGVLGAGVNQNQLVLGSQQAAADDAYRYALEEQRQKEREQDWERTGAAAARWEEQQRQTQQQQQRYDERMQLFAEQQQRAEALERQKRLTLLGQMTNAPAYNTGFSPYYQSYVRQPQEYLRGATTMGL